MITYKEKPNSGEELRKILNPNVENWFFNRFENFSLPQLFGVMEIHSRNNVLISAPTGATKTLTSFLSVLNELVDSSEKGILEDKIYCVYVSPLKALNEDIKVNLVNPLKEMEKLSGKEFGIRVGVRTGDTSTSEKSKMLRKPPHILITTPESLAILLTTKKFVEKLAGVEWVIVDEIHSLAENKRGVHLSMSLERLQRLCPGITRVGLSATVAPIEEVTKYLVGFSAEGDMKKSNIDHKLRDCKIIDVQFIKELELKVLSPVNDLIGTSHEQKHHKMYELMNRLIQKHKTTLIFTNTRAATERVVDTLKTKFPKLYKENIGAHHGSLAKDFRHGIESRLRKGELKVVVSSTSLELGIDIGYIDLVILLGSPKSVARALQRVGRSGHSLHAKTNGRIIVMDRDDLIECTILLKSAMEKKIDRIHIPRNSLDVLVQHIYGIAIQEEINIHELFNLIKQSYCYHDLDYNDFRQLIEYLNGDYVSLEERYIYRKIFYNEDTETVRARGRLARMLYMTNIGTIPDEAGVKVKVGAETIGIIDETFLERLKRGDVFVLGGDTYEFLYSRGTVAQVRTTSGRPPTVPSWVSEMLPLSFDLGMEISKFRRLMEEKLDVLDKDKVIEFLLDYLYIDEKSANAIYNYFREQHDYLVIPHDKKILIEYFQDDLGYKAVFHTLFGRRVNDALSRAVGYVVNRTEKLNVEVGINDNGFFLATNKKINAKKALKMLREEKTDMVLTMAIENSEVLKRRFRHCATRSLMILRNYMGRTKKVGRQAVSSMILLNAVKRIDPNFVILKEARREVMEDLMDIDNAKEIIRRIEAGSIKIEEHQTTIPSPFSFNLALQGFLDVLKIDDKIEFLRKMHEEVLERIAKKGKMESFAISQLHKEFASKNVKKPLSAGQKNLVKMVSTLKRVPDRAKLEMNELIKYNRALSQYLIEQINEHRQEIEKQWPKKLRDFILKKVDSNFDYHAYWEDEARQELLNDEERQDKAVVDFKDAARKEKVSDKVVDEILVLLEADIIKGVELGSETLGWIENFYQGSIHKRWTDTIVKYLKERYEKWREVNV